MKVENLDSGLKVEGPRLKVIRDNIAVMSGSDKSPKDLPASEFMEACGFFGGPTVAIHVGSKSKRHYVLPKAFLCQKSPYFKAAFEGNFKEGKEQSLNLDEESPDDFELVIQWLYTRSVILPRREIPLSATAVKTLVHEDITRYLNFIVLSDKLQIRGNQDAVVENIRACLVMNRKAVLPHHIRIAVKLPFGHAVRQLFADAAVIYYLDSKAKTAIEPFWLAREVKELDGFARDIMASSEDIWRSLTINSRSWQDPLTKKCGKLEKDANGHPILSLSV